MADYDTDQPEDIYDGMACYDDEEPETPNIKAMAKIKLAPSKMGDEALETYSRNVVTSIGTKTKYAGVADEVEALNARLTPYQEKRLAMERAQTALDTATALFLTERAGVEVDLMALANALEGKTKGNADDIVEAGFSVTAEKQPVGELDTPARLTVKGNALEGSVRLRWKRVRGAASYIVQYATNANGPWTQAGVATRAAYTVAGLTSGTKYWFRVQALGASGPSGWSSDGGCMAP